MSEATDCNPVIIKGEKGKRFFWCSCGMSQKWPHCDGAHKGSGKRPVRIMFESDEEILVCSCLKTPTPPYCKKSKEAFGKD